MGRIWKTKKNGIGIFILPLILVFCTITITHPFSSEAREGISGLKPGVFLLAVPELHDPNFSQAVILLVHYNEEGATGLVINRPTEVTLEEALPDIKWLINQSLFSGGPVRKEIMFALILSEKPPEGAVTVLDHLFFTGDRDVLGDTLQGGLTEGNIRIYSGYSGWGPGQLDREVVRGDWIIMDADSAKVFSKDPSRVWPSLMKSQEKIQV